MLAACLVVLGAPELGRRILGFMGPRAALLSRPIGHAFAQIFAWEAVTWAACAGTWEVCCADAASGEAAVSLHRLLEPFSRRAAGYRRLCAGPTRGGSAPSPLVADTRAVPTETALFDAVYVLLARTPAAAEERQVTGRLDEECAGVENMRRSPLIIAARCGLVAVAWLIAQHCVPGGDGLNQQDAMGCSALRYAIVNKDLRMCACLLGLLGTDPELPDARGDTALLQAVGANVPEVCQMLLERRANAAFMNRGQTALDVAEALSYEGCASVLRERGAPSGYGMASCQLGRADGRLSPESELDEEVRESERTSLPRTSGAASGRVPWGASPLSGDADEAAEAEEEDQHSDLDGLEEEDEMLHTVRARRRGRKRRWDSSGRQGCYASAGTLGGRATV